jgi:hypothetical protein
MPKGVSRSRQLVRKARHAALEAVAAYNNPLASFKSGTYVVLMHVAWTAVLHAVFWKRKVKPWYRKAGSVRFERMDGRPKTWDLSECVRQYWGGQDDAVSQNLRFFIGIRNFIEHADAPEIDLDIFGECQAMLLNFESFLAGQFGDRFSLNATLAFSLQFSRMREPQAQEAMRRLLAKPAHADIRAYIERFRSSLSTDILGDMAYSYKVFLLPMTGSHRSRDALAVEFVHYDREKPQEYDKAVSLIKRKLIPVINLGKLNPSHVVTRVASAIAPKVFNIDTHTRAWKYWNVRPPRGAPNPTDCNSTYCQFDDLHRDYAYTDDWVDFLVKELSDDATYKAVRAYRPQAQP